MQRAEDGFSIGAVLKIKRGKKVDEVTPVTVYRKAAEPAMSPAALPNSAVRFELISMNVGTGGNKSTVALGILGVPHPATISKKAETLVVEFSVKPFIGLVWLGTLLALGGLFVAFLYRVRTSALPFAVAKIAEKPALKGAEVLRGEEEVAEKQN
jgi:cytochrome c-type biogenesis protein CcmF